MNLSIPDQLTHNTIRIETETDKDKGTGTGFFFEFMIDGKKIPTILTNKHVIKNSNAGKLVFKLLDANKKYNVGNENYEMRFKNFEKMWISHPNDKIDLCILPIAPILEQINKRGKYPYYITITEDLIPNLDDKNSFTSLEEIIMIGYPIGIWDETNNLPLIRKGITATHPSYKCNNKNEFLIDVACFPGSSGSPVFLLNIGNYPKKEGGVILGNRIKFLGVLYAGPQYTAEGEIKIIEVPTNQKPITQTNIPTNLGCVIKSNEISEFKNVLKDILKNNRIK